MREQVYAVVAILATIAVFAFALWISYQRYQGCMDVFDNTRYCIFGG